MNQPEYILKAGTKVRTHEKLENTKGMFVVAKHLNARTPNAEGTIAGVVGGHGGDVYWVKHEGVVHSAAYCFTEFELVE